MPRKKASQTEEVKTEEIAEEPVVQETDEDSTDLVPESLSLETLKSRITKENNEKISRLERKFSTNKRGLHADSREGGGFRPQIIKMRQTTTSSSPEKTPIGEMFTNNNVHIGKEFFFIPLNFWRERVKWPEGAAVSDQPQCKSTDGIYGFWEQREWRECAGCPYRKWDPAGGPRGTGWYPCKESMNVLGLDEEFTDFFRIQFSGASVKVAKKFYSSIRGRDEIFDAIWRVSTEKQKSNPAFQYTVPEVSEELEAGSDLYVIADFFLDQIENTRAQMQERQKEFMNSAKQLAAASTSTNLDGQKVEDEDATVDMNM